MLLGVDKRGFTQRVEREGGKLENREGQTQERDHKDKGEVRDKVREMEHRGVGTESRGKTTLQV